MDYYKYIDMYMCSTRKCIKRKYYKIIGIIEGIDYQYEEDRFVVESTEHDTIIEIAIREILEKDYAIGSERILRVLYG